MSHCYTFVKLQLKLKLKQDDDTTCICEHTLSEFSIACSWMIKFLNADIKTWKWMNVILFCNNFIALLFFLKWYYVWNCTSFDLEPRCTCFATAATLLTFTCTLSASLSFDSTNKFLALVLEADAIFAEKNFFSAIFLILYYNKINHSLMKMTENLQNA